MWVVACRYLARTKTRTRTRTRNNALTRPQLLPEIAGSTVLVHELKPEIVLEIAHGGANPPPIRHQGDATMPRRREAGLSVQQTDCYLVLAQRFVDGKPQMLWKGVLDRRLNALFRKGSAKGVTKRAHA